MSKLRFAGWETAGTILGGAVVGLVAWLLLNGILVENIRGFVIRAGFPWWSDLALFIATGAALGIICPYLNRQRWRERTEGTQRIASAQGWKFETATDTFQPPPLPMFRHMDVVENLISCEHLGISVQMFDLTTADHGGENTDYKYHTVVLFSDTVLPTFQCLPKRWSTLIERLLVPVVCFDSNQASFTARQCLEDFSRHYQLTALDWNAGDQPSTGDEEIRNLFRPTIMAVFAASPGWFIQAADGSLALAWYGFAPAEKREELMAQARTLRDSLVATPGSDDPALPGGAGMEQSRQLVRLTGRGLGGVCGGISGFFGGFILWSSILFSQERLGQADSMFVMFFALPFSGLMLGVILGGFIGSRVADWTYDSNRPFEPQAALPRSVHTGMIAGACTGWMLGGGGGLLITALASYLKLTTMWLMPVLIFSPALVGLFVGGYAGHHLVKR